MESFVFNSFKQRMLNGELSGNDVWTLQPVKKAFTEDYEDNLKYVRNETDLYYLNPSFNELGYVGIEDSFKDRYFTKMHPVHYNYTVMQNTDVAKQPEYITKYNIIDFLASNPDEAGREKDLNYLFFDVNGEFYRPSDETELDSDGNEVSIPEGFYYVRTKEELRWCANLVNSEAYNNKINIVLGDNIGVESNQTTLNFIIGENPSRPFEGIFYGNGYKFINIELICDKPVNGIIGYLGTNGIISTVRVAGRNILNCKSKITLEHLMSVGTDVAAGFICGKNNGVIEGIDFDAELVLYNFIPGICSVGNKSDSTLPAIQDNPMVNFCYPDYLCYNSLGNIIPYIGYFNEGVFATYNGLIKDPSMMPYHQYWKTLNFESPIKNGYMIKQYNLDGKDYQSPQEWYYFAGMPYNNTTIDCYTKPDYIRNILFYDSTIFSKINSEYFDHESLQASRAGVLPINHADVNLMRVQALSAAEHYDYHNERTEDHVYDSMRDVNYYDKSIKMQQQNRVAYYVSPIIGINNRQVKDVYVNCSAITSATFVGFLGGLAGKQNYGYIKGCNINLSAYDSVVTAGENHYHNQMEKYGVFHERTIFNTEYTVNGNVEETYSFPLQSIKNIGGMFGSCIIGDVNSLIVKDCNVMFENQHAAIVSSTDVSGINPLSEDYYLLNRYAGIAAMMEFNTSNLSDIWTTSGELNDENNRCVKFENTRTTYRESLGEYNQLPTGYEFVQSFNVGDNEKRYHSVINNIDRALQSINDQPIYGIAAPLVGELKPLYIGTPSMLESLFPNDSEKYAIVNKGVQMPPPYQYYSLSYPYNTLASYFSYNGKKITNNMVGLFYMDQNIAAPVSTPYFYGDSIDVAIPGVKNISSGDKCNLLDSLTPSDTSYKVMSYDITRVLGSIIDWRDLSATNNHDVWKTNDIFKYSVVPSAAILEKAPGTVIDLASGYFNDEPSKKFNRHNYLYPYFGSDFVLEHSYTNTSNVEKIAKGVNTYTLYITNPFYGEVYGSDGDDGSDVVIENIIKKFKVVVNLTNNELDKRYEFYAVYDDGDEKQMSFDSGLDENITETYFNNVNYVDKSIRTNEHDSWDIKFLDRNHMWILKQDRKIWHAHDIWWYVYTIIYPGSIAGDTNLDNAKNNFFNQTVIVVRARDGVRRLKHAKNIKWNLGFIEGKVDAIVSDAAWKVELDVDNDIVNSYELAPGPRIPDDADINHACNITAVSYGVYTGNWLQPAHTKVNGKYYPVTGYNNNNTADTPLIGTKWADALIVSVQKDVEIEESEISGIYVDDSEKDSQIVPSILYKMGKMDYYTFDGLTGWYIEPTAAAKASAYKLQVKEYIDGNLTEEFPAYKIVPATAVNYDDTNGYTKAVNLNTYMPSREYGDWGDLSAYLSANYNDICIYRNDGVFPAPIEINTNASLNIPKSWSQDAVYSGKYKLAVKSSVTASRDNMPVKVDEFLGNYNNDCVSSYYKDLTANIRVSDTEQHKNDSLVDYFKYTYEKRPANMHDDICSAGFKLPVIFEYKNNKAGFWFNMNESAVEKTRDLKDLGTVEEATCSAYNDNMYYTSNVFAIGKTPNQSCIINEHLADPEITAVSFSSFSADDFEGIYVTDGENRPVMYIDVGLGECPEGTTWTYSAYPSYSANIEASLSTSAYSIVAETDEDKAEKLRLIEQRNIDVRNAMNASGLILEVET